MTTNDLNQMDRGYNDGAAAARKQQTTAGLYDLRDHATHWLRDRYGNVYYWTAYRRAVADAIDGDDN